MPEQHAPRQEPAGADWPALMARAQDGDQAAYNRLLKAMTPAIRAMVRRYLRDDDLVEDVVQDVLLAIHRVRHTYDPTRPILPWTAAIAQARAIDALRSRGRRRRREVQDEAALLGEIDPAAARRLDGFAARDEVDGFLARLPGRQRQVIELVRLRELSLADAAVESRLSVPAVKALLHRAFGALRQHGTRDHG